MALVTSEASLEKVDHEGAGRILAGLVDDLVVVPGDRDIARWGRLLRLEPLQVVRVYDRALHDEVLAATARLKPCAVFLSLVRTAPYAQGVDAPVILDYCDALSWQFRMRTQRDRSYRRLVWAAEALLLRRYEKRLNKTMDATMIVSSTDAAIVGGERMPSVVALAYDMDEPAYGSQSGVVPTKDGPWVLMSGDMATSYSADGAEWFAKSVWPLVTRRIPGARFLIVGRGPLDRIIRLGREDPSVIVTGAVRRVGDYLERSDVAIVPLLYGTGVKTRMLEAFALGVPVVATPAADTDGSARAASAILTAREPALFAKHVVRLLEDRELGAALAERARAFADLAYGQNQIAQRLEDCVDLARGD